MIQTRKLRRRQKKQLAFLTFLILLAGIMAIMLLTPVFDISEIDVVGNSVVSDTDIIKSSGIIKGVNTFGISLRKSKKTIEQIGYIESASVKRRLPGKIEISVVEAAGVGLVPVGSGYIIITADGRVIDKAESSAALLRDEPDGNTEKENKDNTERPINVPIVTGLTGVKYKIGKKITSEDPEKLETLLMCLKVFSKQGYIFNMTEIDITDATDILFNCEEGRLKVHVGSTDKLEYKMECLGPILGEIGENPSGYIDLERMTYRKKEE